MSERPSRQRHFPARKKLVRSQIRPKYTRQLPESQSTLTQLNYVVPTVNDLIDHDLSEIYEAEFTESTSRKRRKVATMKARSERQSTLTQWEWFEYRQFSDSEEVEKENHPEWAAQEVEISTTKRSPSLLPPAPPLKSSVSEEIYDLPHPASTDAPVVTPQKPIKKEIPSSQSPAATPISTLQTPQSTGSNRTLYTPPTNMSPLGPKYAGESPLRGKYTGTSRKLVDPKETPGECSKEDSKRRMPHTRTERLPSQSHQKPKESPIKTVTGGYETTRPSKLYDNSRSSRATTVDLSQSSPEASRKRPPLRGRQKSERSLKSRGVDFHGASTSSPPHPRPPSPMPPESQCPLPISSDLDGVDYTPLQPLENSEDLPTISQLLPESMR